MIQGPTIHSSLAYQESDAGLSNDRVGRVSIVVPVYNKEGTLTTRPFAGAANGRAAPVLGDIVWFALSSDMILPHWLSYFNELSGGPAGRSRFLQGRNTDWGQDLFFLRPWIEPHPKLGLCRLAALTVPRSEICRN
jgi:hypothetical protein